VTEVVFLGTSDAFGAGGRCQSAFVMRDAHGCLLIDCGVTTNTSLAAQGIRRDEIDSIVISHFHGDHFGGIPLLLLAALYEDKRERQLEIAGPPGIETRVEDLAIAMGHSIAARDWSFPIVFKELPAGEIHQVGPASLTSFEVHHNKDTCPHGYRIQLDRQTLVYTGDTGWFDELPEYVAGADLLVCECTYCAIEYEMHLNLNQLTQKADAFECERMILTHLGSEMTGLRGDLPFDTADDGLRIKL
jgi:ribonuclease BN (tRNA processing enzyme)